MTARTYVVTDPATGVVFKSRRKTRPYGAVIVDGDNGPRVVAWAGRPDLLDAALRRALNGRRHWSAPDHSARVALAADPLPVVRTRSPRTLAQLTAHPWVEEVSDERGMGQGIWVYLKPGHAWDGCQTIHEETVGACLAQFATVEECPEPVAPVRPVLPGETTPPPAPSHGDAAPSLPQLRADAAARPVSLETVAAAKLAEARAQRRQRRQRREAAAMAMDGVAQLLHACVSMGDGYVAQLSCGDGWILWEWQDQAGRAVDTAADLGWIETREGLGLTIQCQITATGRAALAAHAAGPVAR